MYIFQAFFALLFFTGLLTGIILLFKERKNALKAILGQNKKVLCKTAVISISILIFLGLLLQTLNMPYKILTAGGIFVVILLIYCFWSSINLFEQLKKQQAITKKEKTVFRVFSGVTIGLATVCVICRSGFRLIWLGLIPFGFGLLLYHDMWKQLKNSMSAQETLQIRKKFLFFSYKQMMLWNIITSIILLIAAIVSNIVIEEIKTIQFVLIGIGVLILLAGTFYVTTAKFLLDQETKEKKKALLLFASILPPGFVLICLIEAYTLLLSH